MLIVSLTLQAKYPQADGLFLQGCEILVFALGIFDLANVESSKLARAVYDFFKNDDERALCFLVILLIMKTFAMQVIHTMAITIKSTNVIKI